MKYTQGEIFRKIEKKERQLKVGDITKINREVPFQHIEFIDNRSIFYPPLKTTGEIGKIERVFKIDIGNNDKIIPIEKYLKKPSTYHFREVLQLKFSEKISNRVEAKIGFRLENNPNRKVYVVYLIFTFKDKISEHYSQKDAYGILISDDMILANETESRIFTEREENFKARRIAEQL
jgi:hypothetical protein